MNLNTLVAWLLPALLLYWFATKSNMRVARFVFLSIGFLWLLVPIYYEFPTKASSPATYEEGRVVLHKRGMFCLEPNEGETWFNYPLGVTILGDVVSYPLGSPNVGKKLKYVVVVEIAEPNILFRDPELRKLPLGSFNKVEASALEYTEPTIRGSIFKKAVDSMDYFKTFSPKRVTDFVVDTPTQQNNFVQMMKDGMNPYLFNSGLAVKTAKFEIFN